MSSAIRKLIGSRIKAHRKAMGITQAALAEVLDCEVTTLGRYERGEYAPDGEQLVRMAEHFNVSPMDFLPCSVDIKRQKVIDLRTDLVELVYNINDQAVLERLIQIAKLASPTSR